MSRWLLFHVEMCRTFRERVLIPSSITDKKTRNYASEINPFIADFINTKSASTLHVCLANAVLSAHYKRTSASLPSFIKAIAMNSLDFSSLLVPQCTEPPLDLVKKDVLTIFTDSPTQ